MSDVSLGTFGFDVNTTGLKAGSDELSRFEGRINAATIALDRMEARAASAFAKVPTAMSGMAGPSPMGGSTGNVGGISAAATAQSGLAAATAGGTSAINAQASAFHGAAAAHRSHGAAAHGNALQMMELAHVGRSLFDEMAAGGNILRGLAMEFGRLQIAVSAGEGGISGMLGRVGSFAMRLANPLALATGAVAAFGAASAYSFARYEEGQGALERSLNGMGRRSGMSQVQLNAMAASSAATGGLSTSEGVGHAARYTGAGLSGDLSGRLIEMTKDYGRISGLGSDKAGDALAHAVQDPVRGLSELDKNLGFVDDRLRAQIDDLVRSGHLAQAQALEVDAITKAMHGATDSTWSFSKSLDGVGNYLSNKFNEFGHGVANAFGYGTDQDNLEKNRQVLAGLQQFDPIGNAPDIAALKAEIARLEGNIRKTDADAAAKAKEGRDIAVSGRVGDTVRSLLPELDRARTASQQIELLKQALADPGIRKHLDPDISAGTLGRAYSSVAVIQDQNRPGLRERQDYDLRMSSIKDFGVEDEGLNRARRAELEVLRSTGDVLRATTAAQMAYNEQIGKANSDAEDRLDQAKLDSGLIGLSPYARAKQQLQNEYLGDRGIIERDRVDSSSVLDDKDIRHDLSHAQKLVATSQDAAEDIKSAGSRLVSALDGITQKLSGGSPSPYGTMNRHAFDGGPGATAAGGATALAAAPADVQAMIAAASARTGVPAAIIAALGQKENSYRLTGGTTMLGADGRPSSAYGYGQLTNGAAADVARVVPGFSKYDPNTAVFGSAEYLKILMQRNGGDMTAALNAYGGDPGYAADIARRAGGGIPTSTIHPSIAPVRPIAATADKSDSRVYAQKDSDIDKSFMSADPNAFGTPLGEANRALTAQNDLMKVNAETFGQSTAAIKGAADAQQLWNAYVRQGITPTGDLAAQIRNYGAAAGKAAQDQEEQLRLQKQIQDLEDAGRSGLAGSVSGGLVAAAHGKSFGTAFRSGMSSLGDRLIGLGTNEIFGGLFGQQGHGFGTGFIGSLFGGGGMANVGQGGIGHNAGGTSDWKGGATVVGESGPETVVLPPHAQVMTAGQTSGLMGASRAPNITVGGHSIVIQGNADAKTADLIDSKLAAANQSQWERIVRDLPQIQRDNGQFSG